MNNQQPYEYKYDKIGNLTQNLEDGIEDIEWNIYGKVEKVSKTNGTLIAYRYDGRGNRISKSIQTSGNSTYFITSYVRDASGNVMAIYTTKRQLDEVTQEGIYVKEIPIYGSSRLGQYRPKTDTKKTALGQRIYEFSNHLGNVLVTLTDNKVPQTDGTYSSVVLSASDYYPFGMAMAERTYSNSEYRYGFNGKENDTDFGSHIQDYGFRLYSAAEARFLSVDPLAPSYPWNSTYAFAENSVIRYVDLEGLEKGDSQAKSQSQTGNTVVTTAKSSESSSLWDDITSTYEQAKTELTEVVDKAKEFATDATNFAGGFNAAYVENASIGLVQRDQPKTQAEAYGQLAGDLTSLVVGGGEVVSGGTTVAGAVVVTTAATAGTGGPGIVVVAVTAPVAAEGVAVATHGTFQAMTAYDNLNKRSYTLNSDDVNKPTKSGSSSDYERITKERRKDQPSLENRKTNVSKSDFEKNLKSSGYSEIKSKDGKANIYTKKGNKYTTRNNANDYDGPTADFKKSDSQGKGPDLKIRLKKDKP